jgi:hypothetical protein
MNQQNSEQFMQELLARITSDIGRNMRAQEPLPRTDLAIRQLNFYFPTAVRMSGANLSREEILDLYERVVAALFEPPSPGSPDPMARSQSPDKLRRIPMWNEDER